MKITGICGSLRQDSLNLKILQQAANYLGARATISIFTCGDIPHYNGDLDKELKPETVLKLSREIQETDGILIASPEYNYSIPGPLKNTLDWVSRPAYKSVLAGKPVAILSASSGPAGGARLQQHLRDVLNATLSPVVPAKPFLVPGAPDKFDDEGKLKDQAVIEQLEKYLDEFVSWIEKLSS